MAKNNGLFRHDHGSLYFETSGEGEALVFIHGFTLDHRMWQPQVDFFSHYFKVLTYDKRGFGQSALPTQPYQHHGDLAALLSHLNIKKAHIAGLSLGGEVAIDFALEFPEMTRSLTLLDSSLGGFKNTVDWNVYAQEVGVDSAKKNWINHPVFEATRKNLPAMSVIKPIIEDYSGWHWFHAEPDMRTKLRPSALQRLPEIAVPTLIVTGEHDLEYIQNIARTLHENIPQSQKHIIKNAGHMVNLEKAEEVNSLISKFLKEIDT